jgi:hypothetical protein
MDDTEDARDPYDIDWIQHARDEVARGRDVDEVIYDIQNELENVYDADEDDIANILDRVELNISDLRD